MDVTATAKYVRISALKARDLARQVSGLPAEQALSLVQFSERKAAHHLAKVLKSAIANAQDRANISATGLRVKEAVVDEGPSSQRYWPRARGMVSRIRRRSCHIRVVLTDGQEGTTDAPVAVEPVVEETKRTRKGRRKKSDDAAA